MSLELYIERKLFISFDRLVPGTKVWYNKWLLVAKQSYNSGRIKQFEVKDTVMCRNYTR